MGKGSGTTRKGAVEKTAAGLKKAEELAAQRGKTPAASGAATPRGAGQLSGRTPGAKPALGGSTNHPMRLNASAADKKAPATPDKSRGK